MWLTASRPSTRETSPGARERSRTSWQVGLLECLTVYCLTEIFLVQAWIRESAHSSAKQLSQTNLERVLKREELLLVVFLTPGVTQSKKQEHHKAVEQQLVSQIKVI